jgi:thiosulfate/3-mercaptopyruvate sulfurtransferase
MLRSAGHEHVQVLDGGFVAWRAAEHPTSTAVPKIKPGHFPTVEYWTGVVDAAQVADWDGTVIDARAADRYTGEHEPIDSRAGHIPGAISRPFVDNLSHDDPTFDPVAIAKRFKDVDDPVVYCGSGVTACHNILAMEVAGISGTKLYEGSWSDWSSDPQRPIATGAEPG